MKTVKLDRDTIGYAWFDTREFEYFEEDIQQADELPHLLHTNECKKCARGDYCKTSEFWETYHDDTRLIGYIQCNDHDKELEFFSPFSNKPMYFKRDLSSEYCAIVDGNDAKITHSGYVCKGKYEASYSYYVSHTAVPDYDNNKGDLWVYAPPADLIGNGKKIKGMRILE